MLSEDDKRWIAELVHSQLEASERRMTERIEATEAHMTERIDATEARMTERMEVTEARMAERIESTETRLLTEFHKWASPTEMRMRSHSAALSAIDLEIEDLKDRVKKLENGRSSAS